MCGIFGILQHRASIPPNEHLLKQSATRLVHRGPDNLSVYSDQNVGLAHARLSLLDLSERSNQPFWDKTGTKGLVYNGEIYNFEAIKNDLIKKGINFHTTSDTEVLLEALLFYGCEETLIRLDGMFAFALYDRSLQSLTLSRDRFGIKPLFYHDEDDSFIFASEVQAFMPWIKLEPHQFLIASYLRGFGCPTKGPSFFRNVRIAAPGEIIRIQKGKRAQFSAGIKITDLYDKGLADELEALKPAAVVDRAEELLLASVEKQLVADVPVGALCSGGVDSSIVMAMATKFHNNLAIFHANVVGTLSELDAAQRLSQYLGLDLKYVDTHEEDFLHLIPEIILHYSHPFDYHQNSVPFYKVARLVRAHNIKAVLSGEGSDESYLGYPWVISGIKERLKSDVRQRIKRTPFGAMWKNLRGASLNDTRAHERVILDLDLPEYLENTLEESTIRNLILGRNPDGIEERELITLFQLHYHLRTLLHRNDCLGMASGIEARFPFLDLALVKFAVNLPYKFKVRLTPEFGDPLHPYQMDKWVLREVAMRYIPKDIAMRKKAGFPTTAQQRMKIPVEFFRHSFLGEMLALSESEFAQLFDKLSHRIKIKLLQIEIWGQLFIHCHPVTSLQESIKGHITFSQTR
jgi:asparagine synthase (glutamine-hydrolysing)